MKEENRVERLRSKYRIRNGEEYWRLSGNGNPGREPVHRERE